MAGIPKGGKRGPGGARRRHKGDIMSPEKRSAVMSRIRGRDTGPELAVAEGLREHGVDWEGHVGDLPGRPDFVFHSSRVVVFVDGDFWHGWHFPQWRDKLSEKWEAKIEATRRRDARNHGKLRRQGWKVIRIWEHQIRRSRSDCVRRIIEALTERSEQCFGRR